METPPRWHVEGGTIALLLPSGESVHVRAQDVIACEFRGALSAANQAPNCRPSEALPGLKFNRFALEPWIRIGTAPGVGVARCELQLRNALDASFAIDFLPVTDQFIIDGHWYALTTDLLESTRALLEQAGVSHSGDISLRQYIAIARSSVERLEIFTSGEPGEVMELEASSGAFTGTLFGYQKIGERWIRALAREELGGLLGDEMGLGKTVQVIAALSHSERNEPSLIVGPATVLENWRRELNRFAPSLRVLVHQGRERTGFPSRLRAVDVVLTSYDLASRDLSMFKMISWNWIVLDEAQAIKNPETRRFASVMQLRKRIGLALTGTPVENRLEDLWSILEFGCEGLLGTLPEFQRRFSNTLEGARALQPIATPLILRRRVAEVASDLPQRIDIPVPLTLDPDTAATYEAIRTDAIQKSQTTFECLTELRQLCAHPFLRQPSTEDPAAHSPKYARLTEIVEEIVSTREKCIVFTSYRAMLDLIVNDIQARFQIPCYAIDGRTKVEQRQEKVDGFSAHDGSAVLVLNPRAAGTGLNIVAANHVIHYNLEWNPAVEDQASARAYRRGQTRPVTVHRLFYVGTVEEVMDNRVEWKRSLAATAVVGRMNADDLSDIAAALAKSPFSGAMQ